MDCCVVNCTFRLSRKSLLSLLSDVLTFYLYVVFPLNSIHLCLYDASTQSMDAPWQPSFHPLIQMCSLLVLKKDGNAGSKCGAHNGRCWLWPHTTMGPFDSSHRPYMFLYPQFFFLSFWVSSCMFTVWPVWCEGMTAFIQVTVRWTMSSCEKKKVLVLGVLPWIKDRRSLMVKGKVTVTQTAFSHQLVTCKQWGLRSTEV